jgi:hypothetical protein
MVIFFDQLHQLFLRKVLRFVKIVLHLEFGCRALALKFQAQYISINLFLQTNFKKITISNIAIFSKNNRQIHQKK